MILMVKNVKQKQTLELDNYWKFQSLTKNSLNLAAGLCYSHLQHIPVIWSTVSTCTVFILIIAVIAKKQKQKQSSTIFVLMGEGGGRSGWSQRNRNEC